MKILFSVIPRNRVLQILLEIAIFMKMAEITVIPADAGISLSLAIQEMPAFAGMTILILQCTTLLSLWCNDGDERLGKLKIKFV